MNDEVKLLAKKAILKELDDVVDDYNLTRGTPEKQKIGRREAFPRWFVKKFYPLETEEKILSAVSMGRGGDYECDFFFHFNPNGPIEDQIIVWGQCKLGDDFDYVFDDNSASRLMRVEDRFFDPPDDANEEFKKAAAEFRNLHSKNQEGTIIPQTQIRKEIVIVVAGSLNPQVRQDVEKGGDWYNTWTPTLTSEGHKGIRVIETDDLLRRIILPETPKQPIKFSEGIGPSEKKDLRTNNMSYIGHITGKDLIKLYDDVGDTLFLENPRRYLGASGHTNKAIRRTLLNANEKKQFWKLNNGITATCDKIEPLEDGSFLVHNLKIVNGQQTTTTISENRASIDADVEVGLTIHTSSNPDERRRISTATNRQNALKPYDLMYLLGGDINEHNQIYLDCESNYQKYYYEKQTAGYNSERALRTANVTKRRLLEKAPTAIVKYAFSENPYNAIKLGKLKIFNEDDHTNYLKVFFDENHTCQSTCDHPSQDGYQHKENNGVKKFYTVKNVKELIIPHIFFSLLRKASAIWVSLEKQHQQWIDNGRTGADPVAGNTMWMTDAATTKRFGLAVRTDHVKYYLLYWINQSLVSFDDVIRTNIEDALIEKFGDIQHMNDDVPDDLLRIVKTTVRDFFGCYDDNPNLTWPEIPAGSGTHVTPSPKDMTSHLGDQDHTEPFLAIRTRQHASENERQRIANVENPEGDIVKTSLNALIPVTTQTTQNNESENNPDNNS